MEYRFGNSTKIREIGKTSDLFCPKCGKKVLFSVFSNPKTKLKAELPFVYKGDVYILICPECSAVFTVDEDKGNVLSKGEKLAIGNYDLTEPEKFEV